MILLYCLCDLYRGNFLMNNNIVGDIKLLENNKGTALRANWENVLNLVVELLMVLVTELLVQHPSV